jgi:predicted dehydrogenase
MPFQSHTTRRRFVQTMSTLAAAAPAFSAMGQSASSPNDRLGVALIGCGGRGNSHLERVAELKQEGASVEVVAVCDAYRPRMTKTAEKYGAKAYSDYRELLQDPAVDVVCIATPDHIHGQQAIDSVQSGKHVYCEKPITHWRQFELTKKLAEVVRASDRVFQVGAQGLSDGAWMKMRDLVKEGLIGQPIHAECGYFRVGDWGERGMPIDDPQAQPGPDLDWKAFLGDSPERDFDVSRFFRWRMYEDYSGGPATDLFPHSLSPVIHILDLKMPSMVVATGGKFRYEEREVPDTFNTLIDYPEKVTVAVLGTQGNDYSALENRGAPGRVPVVRGWEGSLTVQGSEVVFIPAEGANKEPRKYPIEKFGDTKAHWQNLFDCIRTGQAPNHTMELGYHVQTALQMGVLALREGRVAHFDAAAETIRV